MFKKVIIYLTRFAIHDIPIHIVNLLVCWLPACTSVNYIRGFLVSPFLGKCGRGFQLGKSVIINHPESLYIGRNCYISHNCYIQAKGKVYLGDYSTIGPMSIIASSKHIIEGGRVTNRGISEPISIGSGTWCCGHVTLTGGVTVGDNVIVGSGAVVTHDIKSNSLAVGIPAKEK